MSGIGFQWYESVTPGLLKRHRLPHRLAFIGTMDIAPSVLKKTAILSLKFPKAHTDSQYLDFSEKC